MDYQWDPQKARKNYSKHRISFADAVAVFADDRKKSKRARAKTV
jgi:uncharacterized DUF497 family protein